MAILMFKRVTTTRTNFYIKNVQVEVRNINALISPKIILGINDGAKKKEKEKKRKLDISKQTLFLGPFKY